jgi:hypothetical protein
LNRFPGFKDFKRPNEIFKHYEIEALTDTYQPWWEKFDRENPFTPADEEELFRTNEMRLLGVKSELNEN